ncbi:site-specific integrase [Streptomyces sp. SID8499]|uniref:site-specific integrase n=1 Tax=Streptomyces sp. SID8499 TaxID=2706106 RepID=UPI0013CAA9DA|nr:site-specific integrase [Streptomyces sp. SID8499]NED35564.1 tyrosine-type recombinase/integrase [Streptomyces sp. SID8499]
MAEIKKITLKSGKTRWRFVIDAGRDADGKRKQLTYTFDTQTEAKGEYARIQHERRTGQLILPSKLTVAELIDAYLASKADDLEETTLDGYRNRLLHARDYLGHIRLQALTEDDIERWVAWLLVGARRRGGPKGTGLRTSTVDGVLGRFRAALRYAVRKRYVARNVAEYIEVPRKARKADRRENRRPEPWNVVEVKEFIVGARDDRLFAPLLLSLMGLRPAEVAGLRWDEDVDFTAGTLAAGGNTRTMLRNSKVIEKDAKTEAGERTLPLPEPVRLALMNFRVLQEAERATMGADYFDSGYVFVDEIGQPLTTRHLRQAAYRLMAQLDLRRVRLYDARHSCLTFLAVNGVPDVVLAAWAGHTNAAFTKRKYVHPTAADMGAAVTHLNDLLGVADGRSEAAM